MRILGIDYGEKKSGLAAAQNGLVEPLLVLKTKELSLWIAKKDKEEKIEKIVLGLPGGALNQKIKTFGEELKKALSIKVEFFGEDLTTLDAQKILGKIKRKRNYKKRMEDAVAAAIMLESYLERRKNV